MGAYKGIKSMSVSTQTRRRFLAQSAAVGAALALAGDFATADEIGESFWTPGSFASLAATPSQPGFSLTSTYWHTSTTAGSDVARARLIRVGRLTGEVGENVSAISIHFSETIWRSFQRPRFIVR